LSPQKICSRAVEAPNPKTNLVNTRTSLFPSGFGGSLALGMRNSLEISITIVAQRVEVFLRLPVASVPLLVS
jgi:hypothetical protein